MSSKYSNKVKGEKLTMDVLEDSSFLALDKLRVQQVPDFAMRAAGARSGALIGQVISLAIMGVNKLIEIDKSKFTAAYSQSLNELYFYNQISKTGPFDPTGLQFREFSIQRNVKVKGEDVTAFSATFELDKSNPYELLNSSVFRIKIKALKLIYSKAKSSTTKWYVPWTWGNKNLNDKMNMDVEIRFITSYVTADGKMYDNMQVGKFGLNLRNMPMNPKSKEYTKYYQDLIGKRLDGYSFLIPRSFGYVINTMGELEPAYSQGNYRIEVSVKESGKEKFIKKVFADNANTILKEGSKQVIKTLDK